MNWKLKAFVQNVVGALPEKMSYNVYFQMQRKFGKLKKTYRPVKILLFGIEVLNKIKKYNYEINGKIFFEVGTGWYPLVPISFWLAGAAKVITVDLNPYLRDELIIDMLSYINKEQEQIKNMFGDFLNVKRFEMLLDYSKSKKINKEDLLKLCQIEYISPGDAAKTNLSENCINYHISNSVYEYIPFTILRDILTEGNRIILEDGLFINWINYSDMFARTDKKISPINFLQYSDKEWEKYSDNRFAYMTRARHDDYIELFKSVGHNFVETEPFKDRKALELLQEGKIKIDAKFKEKGAEILSITGSTFITKVNQPIITNTVI